ncbi:unnamed protein product, partial [Iphiclides podalirius]
MEVKTEEDVGVKYANRCEVCKVLATELQGRLEETGKVHDVIEIGYSLDDVQPKKKTKYEKSELRLIESLEGVCERILEYNIHKERQDSTRFAKEITQMKTQCESLLEENEAAIEEWYWNHQGTIDLKHHLCTKNALRNSDDSCLFEDLDNSKGEKSELYKSEL